MTAVSTRCLPWQCLAHTLQIATEVAVSARISHLLKRPSESRAYQNSANLCDSGFCEAIGIPNRQH